MGTQVEGRVANNIASNNVAPSPVFATPTVPRFKRTPINVTPSPKAVVKSGDFSYFAESGMSPLPYALSEFVDNSLAAINARLNADSGSSLAPNIVPGQVRISFHRVDKGGGTVIIWDNGCGMNENTLKDFAIYALSPEDRLARLNASIKKSNKESSLSEFYSNPLRVNSNISMFGVGAKMSAFFIGTDLTMVTKCAQSTEVHEFRCNSDKMNSEYLKKGNECYEQSINNRAPGSVTDSEVAHEAAQIPRLKEYIEVLEKQHNSFTYVVINGVKKDFVTRFEKNYKDIAFSLASVYHWYLHGHPTIKTPIGGKVSISLAVNNLPVLELNSVPSVIKEQIARQKDTFSFEVVDNQNGFAVFGFVNYFPFNDVETYPKESRILAEWCGAPEPDSDDEDDDDVSNNGVDPSGQSIPPVFSCWWQGRLIPITTVESLNWMNSSFKQTTSRCRYRIKGCLFFDKTFKVTQNKSTFTDDVRGILERQTAMVQLVDNSRGPVSKLPRSSKTVDDSFKEWIKSCHDRYDKEVQLRRKRPKESHTRWRSWLEYDEMVISGSDAKAQRVFKAGDVARISASGAKKPRFGRIIKFLRANPASAEDFETHPDAAFVSGSDRGLKCEVQALPEFCFPSRKDQEISVKLRMIDKSTSTEEVLRQLEAFKLQQLKHIPKRLDFYIYDPGTIPRKVAAGYKFPNVDVQILSCSGEALTGFPFEPSKKLKARQRFYIKNKGELMELKCFDGFAREKKFQFWEIDTLFKKCGFYSCVFDIPNYISPLEDAILNKTYEFQVTPGQPTSLTTAKASLKNPLTITLGALSTGEVSVSFTDEFGNACVPDDIFLNNLVLSHDYLTVKPKPFKVVNGNVVIANIYTEPKTAEGGKFVTFRQNEITSLDVGVKGRPNGIGTIPVKFALGEPYGMEWYGDGNPLRVTSGGSLPSLNIQLVDRYGLPAKPNPTVKSLSIKLLDSESKLNGLAGREVKVSDFTDPSGRVLCPLIQINSGLDRVTLRASLTIRKLNVSSRTIDLDRVIIVQPGNMLGRVELRLVDQNEDFPSVIVGSTYSLQIDLFGENGQLWPKPYSGEICKRYELHYNGKSMPVTPLGIFTDAVTFPEKIPSANPFRISATVVDISPDSVNIPIPCQTTVNICPDAGVEWVAAIMRPIYCGEPLQDAIQIRFVDQFKNPRKINPNNDTRVKFGGGISFGQGSSSLFRLIEDETCLTYPGMILVGKGPGNLVIVNDQTVAKFEILEGPPYSLVLGFSDSQQSFQQPASHQILDIDIPITAYSKREFHVHAVDAAGSNTVNAPNIDITSNDVTISPIPAQQFFKKAFSLHFHVPAHQPTVTVTIKCDKISNPFICRFPVQPWLLGVSAVNLDPITPGISAGSPFPSISGHILNTVGNPMPLTREMLSSLSLVVRNTDDGRDLGPDLFSPAAATGINAVGAFVFAATRALTKAGVYTICVMYTERRPDVLDLLPPDQLNLQSRRSAMEITPGRPYRLHVSGDSEEPSIRTRPIPSRLVISVQDEFGNPTPHRFQPADVDSFRLRFADGIEKDHLTRPLVSVDASGNLIVQSLGPNPHRPLPKQTYELEFKMVGFPLRGCSLEFFYSPNAEDISEYGALAAREEDLLASISAMQTELRQIEQAASLVIDRLNENRDQVQAIISHHVVGQDADVNNVLNDSKVRLNALRVEIAGKTKTAIISAGNHQRFRSINGYIGVIGFLATCSNEEDARLVSYALGRKLSQPIFRSISPAQSKELNIRHMSLELMGRGESSLARNLSAASPHERKWATDPVPLINLVYPHANTEPEVFKDVFSRLLSNFLACRTYADGMAYKRYCVNRRLSCGTILTYDGQIIHNTGELGDRIPEFTRLQVRIGIEPRPLRQEMIACERRIQDLERLLRLVNDERQLLEQQSADNDRINSIQEQIRALETDLESVRQQMERADPSSAGNVGRKRRRASAGGPTARGQGPAARRRHAVF